MLVDSSNRVTILLQEQTCCAGVFRNPMKLSLPFAEDSSLVARTPRTAQLSSGSFPLCLPLVGPLSGCWA